MVSTAPITGSIVLPDASNYASGVLLFTLSGFDTEGSSVVGTGTFSCTLSNGAIPNGFAIWRNVGGIRDTYYTVQMRYSRTLADGSTMTAPTVTIGTITVGDAASYDIAELLDASANGDPLIIDYGSIASAVTRSADYGSIA
mgnify:FL=1